jgi:hypothetical protein
LEIENNNTKYDRSINEEIAKLEKNNLQRWKQQNSKFTLTQSFLYLFVLVKRSAFSTKLENSTSAHVYIVFLRQNPTIDKVRIRSIAL